MAIKFIDKNILLYKTKDNSKLRVNHWHQKYLSLDRKIATIENARKEMIKETI